MLEKTPESPLDSKEIQPVNLKGDQPWIFTGRIDAEASVFWSYDANRWLMGKVPDAGKDWGQKERRASEDEMAGRHHWCNEHELGQTLGDGERQEGLPCCSPWGRRESDMTGWLNNKNNKIALITGRSKEHQTGTQFTVTVGNVTLPQLFLFYWWARQFGRTHLSSAAIIFIQLWRLLKFPRTRAGEGGWSRMYDGVPCNWRATLSYLQPVAWSQGDGFSLS